MSDQGQPSFPEDAIGPPGPTDACLGSSITAPAVTLPWTPHRRRAWWSAVTLATVMTGGLGWLLARLVWLPFFFGLFFYLVAGLLAGATVFRLARKARPIHGGRVLGGVIVVALLGSAATAWREYRYVASTIGQQPRFADARNTALAAGRPVDRLQDEAEASFNAKLRRLYPPGGTIGYVRWAIASGEFELTVDGCKETVSIDHRGLIWSIRTMVGFGLLAMGLWSSLESLRSALPVSNILAPGEEAEEEDD